MEKKYMQNRKLITFTCDCCGKEAQKPLSEYNRNIRLGRHNFCSRTCACIYNNKHTQKKLTDKMKTHLQNICGNRHDEFSEFRYILRNVRKRFKNVDIDLQYLKDLWNEQNGICPYTGIHMMLPTYNHNCDYFTVASLDRIDSSKGYVKGNIQYVVLPINFLKSTMSDLAVKRFLKQISSYTSAFTEDETISSRTIDVSGAQAGN